MLRLNLFLHYELLVVVDRWHSPDALLDRRARAYRWQFHLSGGKCGRVHFCEAWFSSEPLHVSGAQMFLSTGEVRQLLRLAYCQSWV